MMTRHASEPRRHLDRRRGVDLVGRAIAVSALAGGWLTVVALWRTSSRGATTGTATR